VEAKASRSFARNPGDAAVLLTQFPPRTDSKAATYDELCLLWQFVEVDLVVEVERIRDPANSCLGVRTTKMIDMCFRWWVAAP
jgi:hypothetical protein